MFKKLLPLALTLFIFLTACGPQSASVSDSQPTATAVTATSTPQTTTNLAPRWQLWSSMGFGKRSWLVEILGENEACVMDLKQNPKACLTPITIRPQNDLVIVKDNFYYMTLLKGDETTIDFNTGVYDFYTFDYGRGYFATGWQESAFMFDVITPILLTENSENITEFINLTDGRTYLMDQGNEYFKVFAAISANDYPVFGYLHCSYDSDYILNCLFTLP
ncbi:MAG: hypothetical protein WAV41_02450 [Microgenomates group bacterium]